MIDENQKMGESVYSDTKDFSELEFDCNVDGVKESKRFYDLMRRRRTIRNFSSKNIDEKILRNAILTAGSAPNGANKQPWHFAIIKSQELKSQLRQAAEQTEKAFYERLASQEWLDDLKPLKTHPSKPFLEEAPCIIGIFARRHITDASGRKHRCYYAMESTGIATGMLISALHASGLATLTHTPKPMAFLNQLLDLDKSYVPFLLLVTGYPKQPILVPQITKKSFEEIATYY